MPPQLRKTLFRFVDYEVDLRLHEVRRRGTPVAVEPKAFDLLVYLIENRDRAIEKHELQQAIWGGASITDTAVTRCVMKARRLVGDDSKKQSIIKTLHGHGYRFVAELKEPPEGEPTATLSIEKYREALQNTDRLSIAVLPFKDLGNRTDQEYFAEGFTNDVITELSRFSSLFVTSPYSSMPFKDSHEDAQTVAHKLGVAYIVQGSIRRTTSRIRITVHLTEAASERRLWSEHYDRDIEEVTIIHGDVASTVAATIGGRVEAHRVQQRLDGAGVKAYDYVLQAKKLHYIVSKPANAEARALLQKAIEEDPGNVRAHAWLASVHAMDGFYFWTADPEESTRLALEYGRKSIAMDDSECTAHFAYGEIMHGQGEFELAESHLVRAMELNPNCIATRAIYAFLLVCTDRAQEAVQHIAVAEKLDPFGLAWTPWAKGTVMYAVGRYPEAIRSLSQIDHMDNTARPWLAAAYVQVGDLTQARLVLEKFLSAARDDMVSFPGKDEKTWRWYLRREMACRQESIFEDFYRVLVRAGWLDLLDALPDSSNDHSEGG